MVWGWVGLVPDWAVTHRCAAVWWQAWLLPSPDHFSWLCWVWAEFFTVALASSRLDSSKMVAANPDILKVG